MSHGFMDEVWRSSSTTAFSYESFGGFTLGVDAVKVLGVF